MVLGTATFFLLACMNCNMAIWAVASCIATRSGRSANIALPRSQIWVSKLSACETSTFSASVRPRLNFFLALANKSGIFAYRFLAISIDISFSFTNRLGARGGLPSRRAPLAPCLFQRRHFPPFWRRIVDEVIEQPDQAAILTLLIHPMPDQPDRA